MKKILLLGSLLLIACSPIKSSILAKYQLTGYSAQVKTKTHPRRSILVTKPEAFAGYQSEKMLYVSKSYELASFANNAWVDDPASMLHPLIVESLQKSGKFKVVATHFISEPVDYRLDTSLIKLQQNFTVKPSVLELSLKVGLINVVENRVVASTIFNMRLPCPADSPYGGVVAANKATTLITAAITDFVSLHT